MNEIKKDIKAFSKRFSVTNKEGSVDRRMSTALAFWDARELANNIIELGDNPEERKVIIGAVMHRVDYMFNSLRSSGTSVNHFLEEFSLGLDKSNSFYLDILKQLSVDIPEDPETKGARLAEQLDSDENKEKLIKFIERYLTCKLDISYEIIKGFLIQAFCSVLTWDEFTVGFKNDLSERYDNKIYLDKFIDLKVDQIVESSKLSHTVAAAKDKQRIESSISVQSKLQSRENLEDSICDLVAEGTLYLYECEFKGRNNQIRQRSYDYRIVDMVYYLIENKSISDFSGTLPLTGKTFYCGLIKTIKDFMTDSPKLGPFDFCDLGKMFKESKGYSVELIDEVLNFLWVYIQRSTRRYTLSCLGEIEFTLRKVIEGLGDMISRSMSEDFDDVSKFLNEICQDSLLLFADKRLFASKGIKGSKVLTEDSNLLLIPEKIEYKKSDELCPTEVSFPDRKYYTCFLADHERVRNTEEVKEVSEELAREDFDNVYTKTTHYSVQDNKIVSKVFDSTDTLARKCLTGEVKVFEYPRGSQPRDIDINKHKFLVYRFKFREDLYFCMMYLDMESKILELIYLRDIEYKTPLVSLPNFNTTTSLMLSSIRDVDFIDANWIDSFVSIDELTIIADILQLKCQLDSYGISNIVIPFLNTTIFKINYDSKNGQKIAYVMKYNKGGYKLITIKNKERGVYEYISDSYLFNKILESIKE